MRLLTDTRSRIGTADKMIYGHFLEHFHRQVYGGVYDPDSRFADKDGFREDVLEALRKIRTPIIRWPGGCYVSAYNWKYGIGKDRPATFDKAWRVEESNRFGTDEFIRLCEKLGCEPYICTNAGTGDAEEMSDWVEYCNLESEGIWAKKRIENGFVKPHNVKFWSIANENWGAHEVGAKNSGEFSLLVREAAKMMLRVDPTLELSAASIADLDWNMKLLAEAGRYLNWISIHGYWDGTRDGIHHAGYDEVMLKTGECIEHDIRKVRAYLNAYELDGKISIAFDEWNLRGWFHPNLMENIHRKEPVTKEEYLYPRDLNDRNETYTMADAVFSACFLNTCLRNCDIVRMACFSPVVNTRGAIFTHKDGLVLRPTYHVFDLYANLMQSTVLKTLTIEEDSPLGTDRFGKEVSVLDAVVTYGNDHFAISAVNKDRLARHELEIGLHDAAPAQMRIHTLNGPSPDSFNDIGRTEVAVHVSEWMPYSSKITLEPHSVNVVEIR